MPLLKEKSKTLQKRCSPGTREKKDGEPRRIRTIDPRLKRAVLYQLSYRPIQRGRIISGFYRKVQSNTQQVQNISQTPLQPATEKPFCDGYAVQRSSNVSETDEGNYPQWKSQPSHRHSF